MKKKDERLLGIAGTRCGLKETQRLLVDGANPNAKTREGWTALMIAAACNCLGVLKALLSKGADPNAKDKMGWTALLWACFNGHTKVARTLIERGADVEVRNSHFWNGCGGHEYEFPLHPVRLPIASGWMQIRQQQLTREEFTKDSHTPLEWACRNHHVEIVNLLMESGARATSEAMKWACVAGCHHIVEVLLNVGLPATNDDLLTASYTFKPSHSAVMKLLLNAGADANGRENHSRGGTTALVNAARNGAVESVKVLLAYGADVNAEDDHGHTALYHAASMAKIVESILGSDGGRRSVVNVLRSHGAEMSLFDAANLGDIKALRRLLIAGADVKATSDIGRTALMEAALNAHVEAVEMLLEAGSDPNAEDAEGRTPIDFTDDEDVADILLAYRATA